MEDLVKRRQEIIELQRATAAGDKHERYGDVKTHWQRVLLKRLKIHFQNRKSLADAYYDAELKSIKSLLIKPRQLAMSTS